MLRTLREKAKKQEQTNIEITDKKTSSGPSLDSADIRLTKDLGELYLPPQCALTYINGEKDLKNLKVTIKPTQGLYVGGTFNFIFTFSSHYPFSPPKVSIKEKVYHPNLSVNGGVCLNILREEYKPTLTLTMFVIGLVHLMHEPNSDDGLTKEICEAMRDKHQFQRDVKKSMQGGTILLRKLDGTQEYVTYDKVC